jgi:hypothetical protein
VPLARFLSSFPVVTTMHASFTPSKTGTSERDVVVLLFNTPAVLYCFFFATNDVAAVFACRFATPRAFRFAMSAFSRSVRVKKR